MVPVFWIPVLLAMAIGKFHEYVWIESGIFFVVVDSDVAPPLMQ